jgi:hypothetical protein
MDTSKPSDSEYIQQVENNNIDNTKDPTIKITAQTLPTDTSSAQTNNNQSQKFAKKVKKVKIFVIALIIIYIIIYYVHIEILLNPANSSVHLPKEYYAKLISSSEVVRGKKNQIIIEVMKGENPIPNRNVDVYITQYFKNPYGVDGIGNSDNYSKKLRTNNKGIIKFIYLGTGMKNVSTFTGSSPNFSISIQNKVGGVNNVQVYNKVGTYSIHVYLNNPNIILSTGVPAYGFLKIIYMEHFMEFTLPYISMIVIPIIALPIIILMSIIFIVLIIRKKMKSPAQANNNDNTKDSTIEITDHTLYTNTSNTQTNNNQSQEFVKKMQKYITFIIVGALIVEAFAEVLYMIDGNPIFVVTLGFYIYFIILLSFFGLINMSTYAKLKLKIIPVLGIIFAIIAYLITIYVYSSNTYKSNIFSRNPNINHFYYVSIFFTLAIAFTQIGLLLLATIKNNYVRYFALITIFFVSIYSFINIFIILSNYHPPSGQILIKIYLTFLHNKSNISVNRSSSAPCRSTCIKSSLSSSLIKLSISTHGRIKYLPEFFASLS